MPFWQFDISREPIPLGQTRLPEDRARRDQIGGSKAICGASRLVRNADLNQEDRFPNTRKRSSWYSWLLRCLDREQQLLEVLALLRIRFVIRNRAGCYGIGRAQHYFDAQPRSSKVNWSGAFLKTCANFALKSAISRHSFITVTTLMICLSTCSRPNFLSH
jgi:hypothetical protein